MAQTDLIELKKGGQRNHGVIPKIGSGLFCRTNFKQLALSDHIFCRCFNDDERQLFKKGSRDGFLMSVAHPLGSLDYLRIWTDSSGLGDNLVFIINL